MISIDTSGIRYRRGTVKGINAMLRALLMAVVNCRWCLAQLPEILLGIILPRSVTKALSIPGSL
jgi:hypothetical protein